MAVRKRPRRVQSDNERPLLYYDNIRQIILQSQNASGGAIPSGVDYRSSSSILRVNPRKLLGNSEDGPFRLMHVPTLYGFSLSNGGDREVLSYMFPSAKAVLLAVQHFNNRLETIVPNLKQLLTDTQGNICDMHMTLDFYDTERNARIASKRLSRDVFRRTFPYEATAIAGAVRSTVSIPLAILNSVRRLPQIAYASTSSSLDNRDTYELFGRVIPSSDGEAQALMHYFAELGVSHVGILYVQDNYGTAFRLSLEEAAAERKIQVGSAFINVNQGNRRGKGGIVEAVEQLKSFGYRYFVGIIFTQHFPILTKVASEAGIMGPGFVWMLGDGVSTSQVFEERHPRGSPLAQAVHGVGLIRIGAATQGGHFDRFEKALLASDATKDFRSFFAEKTPRQQDFVKFEENHTVANTSPYQALAFDSVMALGVAACRVQKDLFDGEELFKELMSVEFDGASGPVRMDPSSGSRSYNTTNYVILNVVATDAEEGGMVQFETQVAAEYYRTAASDSVSWNQPEGARYNYSDMTFNPPLSLPELDTNRDLVSLPAYAAVSALAVVLMLSSFFFAMWTWYYRSSHVVRASQPEFLVIICLGVFLMGGSAFLVGTESPPFSAQFADLSCMLSLWFFCTGFSLAFSALFAKTWRINKILSSKNQFRRMVVGPKDVVLPGTCVFLANIVVLLLWQVTTPAHYVEVYGDSLDEYGRQNQYTTRCRSSSNGADVYFPATLFVINGFAIIAANVQAFWARHITTEFSESKYIGLAMAIILQAIVIAIPIFFQDPAATPLFLIRGILILISSSSILYLIFIPKILYWRKWEKEESSRRAEQNHDNDGRTAQTSGVKHDFPIELPEIHEGDEENNFEEMAEKMESLDEPSEDGNHDLSMELAGSHSSSPGSPKQEITSLGWDFPENDTKREHRRSTFLRRRRQSSRESTNVPEVDDVGVQVISLRKNADGNDLRRKAGDFSSGARIVSNHQRRLPQEAVSLDGFDKKDVSFASGSSLERSSRMPFSKRAASSNAISSSSLGRASSGRHVAFPDLSSDSFEGPQHPKPRGKRKPRMLKVDKGAEGNDWQEGDTRNTKEYR